jgi:hypothetical protein
MKQRLFFDRVNVLGNTPPIDQGIENPGAILPHAAYSTPTGRDAAVKPTQIAENAVLIERFPELSLFHNTSLLPGVSHCRFVVHYNKNSSFSSDAFRT